MIIKLNYNKYHHSILYQKRNIAIKKRIKSIYRVHRGLYDYRKDGTWGIVDFRDYDFIYNYEIHDCKAYCKIYKNKTNLMELEIALLMDDNNLEFQYYKLDDTRYVIYLSEKKIVQSKYKSTNRYFYNQKGRKWKNTWD